MEQSNLVKLLSNYGSRVWSLVSVFIFIPLYIKILGSENYGLIGFYTLLLGIVGFADAGMTSAIIKEFSLEHDSNYKFSILRRLENIYWIVCLIIVLVVISFSGIISTYWLKPETISVEKLKYYVSLIGIGIVLQLLSSLYFGALFALNNQVKSNVIQLTWSFSRSAIVLLLLIFISPTLELYLWWQIFCNILYVLILRYYIIKELVKNSIIQLSVVLNKIPKHMVLYIKGMILIAIISAINIQADKIITSSLFRLDVFGFYNMASTLAQIPIIVGAPLISFVFPLLSRYAILEGEDNIFKTKIIFEKIFFLINIAVISTSVLIIFYAKEIILLWTHGVIPTNIFSDIVLDVRLLIIGSFFLAIQFPFYYLLLAKGKTKYTIYQGVIQLIIGLPLLYICSSMYGLKGVPIPWVIINFGSFVYLMIIVFRYYLAINYKLFFLKIFLIPLVITIVCTMLFYLLFKLSLITFIPFVLISAVINFLLVLGITNKIDGNKLLSFRHLYNFPNE